MIAENLASIRETLPAEVKLVAVSKFHPLESILEAYDAGQRVFGENRPQEFEKKALAVAGMPGKTVEWHFLGHLQTNKLKMVLPYASLVQSVDSKHLLDEIQKWAADNGRVVNVLLEMHIGAEETKQGFVEEDVLDLLFTVANSLAPDGRQTRYPNIRFCGLMGMASHTDDEETIRADFARISDYLLYLKDLFPELPDFKELSIGMSGDYRIALEYGATIVRIGTAIFGDRAV